MIPVVVMALNSSDAPSLPSASVYLGQKKTDFRQQKLHVGRQGRSF